MTHEDWRLLLSRFLDGDTSAGEAASLADHVNGCAECRASLDSWRALGERVRECATAELPATFLADLHESVASDTETSLVWGSVEPFARRLVEALAVVAVVAMTLSALRPSDDLAAVERSMTSIQADSGAAAVLLKSGTLTRSDVFLAAVTR